MSNNNVCYRHIFRAVSSGNVDRRSFIKAVCGGMGLSLASLPASAVPKPLPLIVLDPGYGGHDPGAIGVTGLYEKHVALDMARALKNSLERTRRCRVMLTRDDNVFIPLDQRRSFALEHSTDLSSLGTPTLCQIIRSEAPAYIRSRQKRPMHSLTN